MYIYIHTLYIYIYVYIAALPPDWRPKQRAATVDRTARGALLPGRRLADLNACFLFEPPPRRPFLWEGWCINPTL